MFVPVVSHLREPLMPTVPGRAKRWIRSGMAIGFFNQGVFCVQLTKEVGNNTQFIAVGIDPGSKREAYSVKSRSHTYLNILSKAVDWVKDAIESRRNARRSRRNRKTPCRQNRENRSRGCLPPSTKARWQLKLRVCRWLNKMFPISSFVVEDIAATTREGKKKWNISFSPLEVGKKWFYDQLGFLATVETKQGWETKQLRDTLGLKKSQHKLANVFEAHNVDSWVLANSVTGGDKLDNKKMLLLSPMRLHRRQLHMFQPGQGNVRREYGGTRSIGFTRGSIVRHRKLGVTHVGGTSKGRVSLHAMRDGKRLTQNAKTEDIKFLAYTGWRLTKDGVSSQS